MVDEYESCYEKRNPSQKEVRLWLNQVLGTLAHKDLAYPVLMHCTSGKDRTGVVVAALHVPREVIVEEYLLSGGEVQATWIEGALDGFDPLEKYFDRIDQGRIRALVLRR